MAKLKMRCVGKQCGTGAGAKVERQKATTDLDRRIERVLGQSEPIPPAPKMRERLLQMRAAGKLPWLR